MRFYLISMHYFLPLHLPRKFSTLCNFPINNLHWDWVQQWRIRIPSSPCREWGTSLWPLPPSPNCSSSSAFPQPPAELAPCSSLKYTHHRKMIVHANSSTYFDGKNFLLINGIIFFPPTKYLLSFYNEREDIAWNLFVTHLFLKPQLFYKVAGLPILVKLSMIFFLCSSNTSAPASWQINASLKQNNRMKNAIRMKITA